MDINLNLKFNEILKNIDISNKPNLFLHVCCAPCSTAVLQRLYKYFNIFIIYYNPNIDCKIEFDKRLNELNKLISICNYDVKIIYNDYIHKEYIEYVKGYEQEPEGGKRCELCFKLRLGESLKIAKQYINDHRLNTMKNYLVSTLSISPHKNSRIIYDIGSSLCNDYNVEYLPSDFKKEDGYLKSIILSKEYNLYRQDYCGCEFAKMNKKWLICIYFSITLYKKRYLQYNINMSKYIINGGKKLNGEVHISGAKNATLGILAAAIMTDEDVIIENIPDVWDVNVMIEAI